MENMRKGNRSTTTTGKKAERLPLIFYPTNTQKRLKIALKMNAEWGKSTPSPIFFLKNNLGNLFYVKPTGKLFEKALTNFGNKGGSKIMSQKTDIKKMLLR